MQWIQYQLDGAATVEDVLASDARIRIQPNSTPIHFLVADAKGHAAVIEFLGGRMVAHTGDALPIAALTNDTYDASVAYAAVTPPERASHTSSLGRFVQAAAAARNFATAEIDDAVGFAFATLDNVNQPNWTRWNSVFDIGARRIYFRTEVARQIKEVALGAVDFRSTATTRMMDLNVASGGTVVPDVLYSAADNLAVLTAVFRQTTPTAGVAASYIQQRAIFPDSIWAILPPTIDAQPVSITIAPGDAAAFATRASGEGNLTFQWMKNGIEIPGATTAAWSIATAAASDAADYDVVVANEADRVTSRRARLVVGTPEPGRLSNLSVRATAGRASQPLIVGVVVTGGPKRLLVRAVGPTLGALFGVPEVLADPCLEIHQSVAAGDRVVASNDNWAAAAAEGDNLIRLSAGVGAFPLPATSRDAALAVDIDGARTIQAGGVPASASGIVLVEVYDIGSGNSPRLINLSARNPVGTGAGALVAGFVINGNVPKRLLVRGIGPSLAALFGVADALADPRLELHTSSNGRDLVVAVNDNWADEPGVAEAAAKAEAFALPADSRDAALLVTLPAGAYTAVVTGANGAVGNGLVEVYEAP